MDHAAGFEAIKQYIAIAKNMTPMEVYKTLAELTFPQKLWIVSKLNANGIVSWNTDGTALEFDVVALEEYVESTHSLFNTHTLLEFLAEMERHQFELGDKELFNELDHPVWVFRHKYFLRDDKALLLKIVPLTPDQLEELDARMKVSGETANCPAEEEVNVKTPPADLKPEKPKEDVKPEKPKEDVKPEKPKEDVKPPVWPSKENFLRHIRNTMTAGADGNNPQVGQHDPRMFSEKPVDLKSFFEKTKNLRIRWAPPKWEDVQKELQKKKEKEDAAYTNPQPSTSRQAQEAREAQASSSNRRYKGK